MFCYRLSLICLFLFGVLTGQTRAVSADFDFELLISPAQLGEEPFRDGFSGDAFSDEWFLIHGHDWTARFSVESGLYERVGDRDWEPWRPEFFSLRGGGLIAIGFARRPCSWRNPLCFLDVKYFNPQIGVRIYEKSGETGRLRLSNFHRYARPADIRPTMDGRAFWVLSYTDSWSQPGSLHLMTPSADLEESIDLAMNMPVAIIPRGAGLVSVFGAQAQPESPGSPNSISRKRVEGIEYRFQTLASDGKAMEAAPAVTIGTPDELGQNAKAYALNDRVVIVGAEYSSGGYSWKVPLESVLVSILNLEGETISGPVVLPEDVPKCWEQGAWSGGALWVVCGDPYAVEDAAAHERTFENGYGSVEGWRYELDTGRVQSFKFRAPRECDRDWSFPAPVRTTEIIPHQGGVVLYSHAIYCAFISQVSFEGH